jgi:hypothetical protein
MPTLEKPAAFSQFEALKQELREHPVHGARSFNLDQVRAKRFQQDSFSRVNAPLLPKTGVPVVDRVNWTVSDLVRLGRDSIIDFPKAAVKGALYGGIGGFLTALCFRFAMMGKLSGWKANCVSAAVVMMGAMLGSGIKLTTECWSKVKDVKRILIG